MNERTRMEIKVGALVLVSVAAILGFVAVLGNVSFGPRQEFFVDFDHSGGLKKGAPVLLAGVNIGQVESITLHRNELGVPESIGRPRVRVSASVPSDQFAAIPSDVSASISARSVLGEKHLELTPGNGAVPPLKAGTVLQGRPPAGIEKAGDDAVSLIRRLERFMDENEGKLSGAIVQVNDLATGLNAFLKLNGPKLDEAVENLRLASAGLAREAGPGGRVSSLMITADRVVKRIDAATAGTEKSVPELIADVSRLSARADHLLAGMDRLVTEMTGPTVGAVRNLNDISETISQGKGTIGKLVLDQTLYDDVSAFVKEIKAKPWKLLWKK